MSPLEPVEVPAALRGLRVAVLVGGGIAAYKIADLVSRLVQAGCPVRVGMTPSATRFVGEATFRGVSGQPVELDLWSGAHPEPHVELGDWAQLLLLAPATANLLSRVAHGQADDLVTATVLAARCPVVVAPAMNDAMWDKPAVRENVETLRSHGCTVVEPEKGHLASGHVGSGRLAGAAAILAALAEAARTRHDLAGRRVVVSAGGTREPIDPVRFVGNYSSGKMGFAMAAAAAERGAEVALVTTAAHPLRPAIRVVPVETAAEMLEALRGELPGADLLVMAAAVADFRPSERAPDKIRREERAELVLRLERNTDILAELAREPAAEGVFRLGFAAEGDSLESKAVAKLERKGLDGILANDVRRKDIAFGSEHNAGLLLFRDGTRVELARMGKREMADRILDAVAPRLT
ncbi:bifunctional phosphopantothenoylcysteine decarboxylase/phosphopantothenate--cysteine ligase CoaBC [Candidatus Nephthysia bennettiae]|uniref:bifunctional phosphopantothenoylcysteine decarboxylase/phosphopantothenate--cysteine ligase CoaBC n=1 Tax=Candidatus Nephthysia bennettiae TaxID=3127016 RepID=UPI0030C68209